MNQVDYDPLIDAIEGGDVVAVESFLQTPGVEVDFLFEDEYQAMCMYTLLDCAVRHNHKAIVEVFLAHGASVNGPVGAWLTPLQVACADNYAYIRRSNKDIAKDIVKLLIDHGADVDGMTEDDSGRH